MVWKVPVKPRRPVFNPRAPGAKDCNICLPIGEYERGLSYLHNIAPNSLIKTCDFASSGTPPIWTNDNYGTCLEITNIDSEGVIIGTVADALEDSEESTFVVVYNELSSQASTGAMMSDNLYQSKAWVRLNQTDSYFQYGDPSSSSITVTRPSPVEMGVPHIYIFTAGPRGGEYWDDGILRAITVSAYSAPSPGGGSDYYRLWGTPSGNEGISHLSRMSYFSRYKRQLTVQEIQQIFSDPWAMIRPPKLFSLGYAPVGGAALLGIVNDEQDIDETVPRLMSMYRIIDDEQDVDETVPRLMSMSRVIDEEEDIDETNLRLMALNRVIDEEEDVDETTARARDMARAVDEVEDIDETTLRPMVMYRVVDEAQGIDESTIRISGIVRLVDEVEDIDESTGSVRGFVRLVDDTENIVDANSSVRGFIRAVDETENIDETTLSLRGFVRLVDETENVDETLPRLMDMSRVIDEAEDIVETTLSPRGLVRISTEEMDIVEAAIGTRALVRLIAEVEDIVEDSVSDLTTLLIKVVDEIENSNEVIVYVKGAAGAAIFEEFTIILKNVTKDITLSDGSGDIVI